MGFVVQFCVNVPGGSSPVRRDTTVPLYSVATARTDLQVEAGIPATEIVRVANALDNAALRVERVFGRPFSERPRVLLFATPASFARGAEEIFDYSPETARLAASSYGGIVDQATLTIAVDYKHKATQDLAAQYMDYMVSPEAANVWAAAGFFPSSTPTDESAVKSGLLKEWLTK